MRGSWCSRILMAVVTAMSFWLLLPSAAGADQAEPGGTESIIDRLSPEQPGVEVKALGGDTFLELTSDGSAEVVVLGYEAEPYLRILTDGTVEQNKLSPAVGLNTERYGGSRESSADSQAEPVWEKIGSGSRVAWHDHRSHWMLDSDPVAAPDGVIQEFAIPMEVDGDRVLAEGRLVLVEAPLPWAPVAAAAFALAFWWVLRTRPASTVLLAASAVAATLSWTSWAANPPEAGGFPWPLLLSVGSLVLAAASARRMRSRRDGGAHDPGSSLSDDTSDPVLLASVALLVGWWVGRLSWMGAAVIPSLVPGWLERLGTAAVCGATLAVIARVALRSQRRSVELS